MLWTRRHQLLSKEEKIVLVFYPSSLTQTSLTFGLDLIFLAKRAEEGELFVTGITHFTVFAANFLCA